eukprot:2605927-Amphidinium_carterae.2
MHCPLYRFVFVMPYATRPPFHRFQLETIKKNSVLNTFRSCPWCQRLMINEWQGLLRDLSTDVCQRVLLARRSQHHRNEFMKQNSQSSVLKVL